MHLRRIFRGGIEIGLQPLRRIPAVGRNKDFLDATIGFLLGESTADRDEAALSFLNGIARRQLRRLAPQGLKAAKGRASALLDVTGLRESLEGTSHLGALAPISPISPTRLDYVSLILDQLLQLKTARVFPGLSSKPTEWPAGTTLELLQCWAILHNWGHLFGTFATERGVLYCLDSESGAESDIFSDQQIHPCLRSSVRELVASRNLYRFFYALAALRASTELHNKLREDACSALAVYLDHQKRGSAQYEVYKRVRQLAYHRLHSIMRLELTCDFAAAPAMVSELVQEPELRNDERAPPPPLVQLLKSFDEYQGQELFMSPKAAALVLSHNRALKQWWSKHDHESASCRLQHLFTQPKDWPRPRTNDLSHWIRLRVDGDAERWLEEVRRWSSYGDWRDGNYLITPLQGKPDLECDVYIDASRQTPSNGIAFSVSVALARRCEVAFQSSAMTESLGRSAGRLVVALFRILIQDGIRVELERAPGMGPTGWAVALPARCASRELKRLAEQVADPKRKAEVRAVAVDVTRHELKEDEVILAVIGSTRLYNEETGAVVKEIDGVWCSLDQTKVAWRFLEEKSHRLGGREVQLAELAQFLRFPLSHPERNAEQLTVAGATCVWAEIPNEQGGRDA